MGADANSVAVEKEKNASDEEHRRRSSLDRTPQVEGPGPDSSGRDQRMKPTDPTQFEEGLEEREEDLVEPLEGDPVASGAERLIDICARQGSLLEDELSRDEVPEIISASERRSHQGYAGRRQAKQP